MENEYSVQIDIEIATDILSPSSGLIDPQQLARPQMISWQSIWMTRDGEVSGTVTPATTLIYHNFTDTERRQIFCLAGFFWPGSSGTTFDVMNWNGSDETRLGELMLITDSRWASSISLLLSPVRTAQPTQSGEGYFFLAEGELESDYRIWRQGNPGEISL